MDGTTQPKETLNKSQVFITTAGYKGTFPYERLIGFLVRMVTQPNRCIVLGGTWRLPVEVGLQSKTFIQDQKDEGEPSVSALDKTLPVSSQGYIINMLTGNSKLLKIA